MAIDWSKYEDNWAENKAEAISEGTFELAVNAGDGDIAENLIRGKIGDPQKADQFFSSFDSRQDAFDFSLKTMKTESLDTINNYINSEHKGTKAELEQIKIGQAEGLIELYKKGQLDGFLQKIDGNPQLMEQYARASQAGEVSKFVQDYLNPTPQTSNAPVAPPMQQDSPSFIDGTAEIALGSTGQEIKYSKNIDAMLDAAPPMMVVGIEQALDELKSKGELAAFEAKLAQHPDYSQDISEAISKGNVSDFAELANKHASIGIAPEPSGAFKPIQDNPSQGSGTDSATAQEAKEKYEAIKKLEGLLDEHKKAHPQDTEIVEHFRKGIYEDERLQAALGEFAVKNGDLLEQADGNALAGFFDKDRFIRDTLQTYKDNPEQTYKDLASDDLQQTAFFQYSSMGQGIGMMIMPILNWIAQALGGAEDWGQWMQLDLEDTFQDFQHFFNGNINNIGMSNNEMGLFSGVGQVYNATTYAMEDAKNITRHDRHYIERHNSDITAAKVLEVDSSGGITEREFELSSTPADITGGDSPEQKQQVVPEVTPPGLKPDDPRPGAPETGIA